MFLLKIGLHYWSTDAIPAIPAGNKKLNSVKNTEWPFQIVTRTKKTISWIQIKKNLFSWEFFENDTKFHKKRRGRPVPSVNP